MELAWFKQRIGFEQIRYHFSLADQQIRLAAGFFTVYGWNLIRRHTSGKRVHVLVGLDEPGEGRARAALINDIMRDLRRGTFNGESRFEAVSALIDRIESGHFALFDARSIRHHGKLYIVDDKMAVVTSSNTTRRGFLDNIESGTVIGTATIEDLRFRARENGIDIPPRILEILVEQARDMLGVVIADYERYWQVAHDLTQELLEALLRWLQLATPWQVYLKTMLALEQVKETRKLYKPPLNYQRDMINQTLRQIESHNGAMIVASTGLGKTVVATHVALQLAEAGRISNVLIFGPATMRQTWGDNMRQAGLHFDYFPIRSLDKEDGDRNVTEFERLLSNFVTDQYFVIVDEAHDLRNRISQKTNEERRAYARIYQLAHEVGCKVLLLTASPFAKTIENINNQLALLPAATAENSIMPTLPGFDSPTVPQMLSDLEDFNELEFTSQLTTPHVAKYYTKNDDRGRYLDMGEQRIRIPRVWLHRVSYALPMQEEMASLLRSNLLNTVDKSTGSVRTQLRVAWASSPWELARFLASIAITPGIYDKTAPSTETRSGTGVTPHNYRFITSLEVRSSEILPIVTALNETFLRDVKYQALLRILRHYLERKRKVIIFCERHATVAYLSRLLEQDFGERLKVFATISGNDYRQVHEKDEAVVLEGIQRFAPEANNALGTYSESYDLLIGTDKYGIGLNMQDADVVVSYDLAWTPIEPIQRAGRVLRLSPEPRTVELYTFVPEIEPHLLGPVVHQVLQRWETLVWRHDQSQKLVDFPTLTQEESVQYSMADLETGGVRVTSGVLNIDNPELASHEVSPYFLHTSKLQQNRNEAEALEDDLVSAKVYSGEDPLIYVLLKVGNIHYWPVLNLRTGQLSEKSTVVKLLELIAANEDEEAAVVDRTTLDLAADRCVEAWTNENNFDPLEAERVCTLFLKPAAWGDDDVSQLFAPSPRS